MLLDVMFVRELNLVKGFFPCEKPKVTSPAPLFVPVFFLQQYGIFSHVASKTRIEFPYLTPRPKGLMYDTTH